jgi:hypothetical protein
MIVTEMQKANANFKEVLSVAQTIAPPPSVPDPKQS